MKQAILGIGIPGSGKSTILKPMANQMGYGYVNRDDIRAELTGDPADHTREAEVSQIAAAATRDALKQGGVVIDGTLSKRRDRAETVKLCRQAGAEHIQAIWFDPPLEESKRRNAGRGRVVPNEVLDKLYARLIANPPSLEEGFDDIEIHTE